MAKKLTRICTSCGIEKPLSAFLLSSGILGSNYSALCHSCRSNQRDHDDEESTGVSSDKRIGIKEKVQAEQDKKRQAKDLKELFIKEAQKKEEESTEKDDKESLRKKAERDHRRFYLEAKQNQELSIPDKSEDAVKIEEKKKEQDKKHAHETQKQEELIKQEMQITSLDFSQPFVAGQTNQLRMQSDTFLKFKSLLGGSAPLVRTLEQLYGKKGEQPTSTQRKSENPTDSIADYIEKREHHHSRKKR